MTKKAIRQFFRFHLSSLMLASLVCGGLLWLNSRRTFSLGAGGAVIGGSMSVLRTHQYGWPYVMFKKVEATAARASVLGVGDYRYPGFAFSIDRPLPDPPSSFESIHQRWYASGVWRNAVIAFTIILATFVFSEFIIRRRERRRTPQ